LNSYADDERVVEWEDERMKKRGERERERERKRDREM
jgi:hypothetical protein